MLKNVKIEEEDEPDHEEEKEFVRRLQPPGKRLRSEALLRGPGGRTPEMNSQRSSLHLSTDENSSRGFEGVSEGVSASVNEKRKKKKVSFSQQSEALFYQDEPSDQQARSAPTVLQCVQPPIPSTLMTPGDVNREKGIFSGVPDFGVPLEDFYSLNSNSSILSEGSLAELDDSRISFFLINGKVLEYSMQTRAWEMKTIERDAAFQVKLNSAALCRQGASNPDIVRVLITGGGPSADVFEVIFNRKDGSYQGKRHGSMMREKRLWHCMVDTSEGVLVVGGYDGGKSIGSCELLIEEESKSGDGRWVEASALTRERSKFACCVFRSLAGEETVYAFGGVNKKGIVTNTIECYRASAPSEAKRWSLLEVTLPEQLECPAAVPRAGTQIFVIGAYREARRTCGVFLFNPGNNTV